MALMMSVTPATALSADDTESATNTDDYEITWDSSVLSRIDIGGSGSSFSSNGITVTCGSSGYVLWRVHSSRGNEINLNDPGSSITFTHESTKIKSIEIYGVPSPYVNISPWYHPVDGDVTYSGIFKWSAGTAGPQSSVEMLEKGEEGSITNISKVVFTVVPIHVTGVSLDKTTTQTVNKDNTTPYVTFTASISPDNATDKKVKWSVNNDNVKLYSDSICQTEVGTDAVETLTVYAKGMSAGNATVTVTTNDSSKTASCNMVVEDVNTVINLINALPAAENVTVNDVDAIDAARNAYENLAYEVKESFSSEALKKLTDAEEALRELDRFYVDSGDGSTWTKGSGSTLPFVFKKIVRDELIREFFKGVKVDGNSVDPKQDGTKNYDIGFGSVVITFQPAYLERLSLGDHIVTASFGEKTVDAKFTINPAPESSEDTTPKYRLPKTGIE